MKENEFYSLYANMPLEERFKDQGGMSAYDIYKEMQTLDDQIRPFAFRKQELLRIAEKIYKFYE